MQCTDLGPQMLEYLAGTLPDDRLAEIRAHLAECAACRDDVDASAELWNELGAAPAPRPESARMRARFDAALQGYIDGQTESRVLTALKPSRPSWQSQPWVQFAGAAALLVLGVDERVGPHADRSTSDVVGAQAGRAGDRERDRLPRVRLREGEPGRPRVGRGEVIEREVPTVAPSTGKDVLGGLGAEGGLHPEPFGDAGRDLR